MVNGVEMVFSEQKMIDRLVALGMENQITAEILEMMDNFDNQPVSTACWSRQVKGEPVLACTGKDGAVIDVAECDCIVKV